MTAISGAVEVIQAGQVRYRAGIYGKSEGQIIAELGELIFLDPASGQWQTADEYLSGNVREKLLTAERCGTAFVRNAVALRAIQPDDELPGDIDVNLGAPWIPASDIQGFAAELFHVEVSSVPVAHLPKDVVWNFEPGFIGVWALFVSPCRWLAKWRRGELAFTILAFVSTLSTSASCARSFG